MLAEVGVVDTGDPLAGMASLLDEVVNAEDAVVNTIDVTDAASTSDGTGGVDPDGVSTSSRNADFAVPASPTSPAVPASPATPPSYPSPESPSSEHTSAHGDTDIVELSLSQDLRDMPRLRPGQYEPTPPIAHPSISAENAVEFLATPLARKGRWTRIKEGVGSWWARRRRLGKKKAKMKCDEDLEPGIDPNEPEDGQDDNPVPTFNVYRAPWVRRRREQKRHDAMGAFWGAEAMIRFWNRVDANTDAGLQIYEEFKLAIRRGFAYLVGLEAITLARGLDWKMFGEIVLGHVCLCISLLCTFSCTVLARVVNRLKSIYWPIHAFLAKYGWYLVDAGVVVALIIGLLVLFNRLGISLSSLLSLLRALWGTLW
ncbi:hypothetical protein CALCODRAFT_505467 [Calocera cornea HHB12733]|uniref:Uncharacterized protein n=1 Tax=Calocera cornea HHB12733 TaxID=1353952 RepID=A0A165K5K8_9BASI|nr:hypothetical protein CALCODRAFT_505467 [Calocera cornea HHB12733]